METDEGAFTMFDLYQAEEAMLTASTYCLLPVVKVNGLPLGDGKPGRLVGTREDAAAPIRPGVPGLVDRDLVVERLRLFGHGPSVDNRCRPVRPVRLRPMQRLRPLNEQECYLRCYGWVGGEDAVRVLRPGDDAPEATAVLTERIRLAFEARLGEREREAEAA